MIRFANTKRITLIAFFISFSCFQFGFGQSVRLEDNDAYHDFIEQLQIKYGNDMQWFTSIKNYDTKELTKRLYAILSKLTPQEQKRAIGFLNQYNQLPIEIENQKVLHKKYVDDQKIFYTYVDSSTNTTESVYRESKPLLKYFYKNPYHLLSVNTENFKMNIDPILDIRYGKETGNDNIVFKNTRGLVLSGYIDDKVYFRTSLLENQQQFMGYITEFIGNFKAIPEAGGYKGYNSTTIKKLTGYDFFNAQGYVGVPITKSINIELGHGRHELGDGIRSLLLSNFSNNYFYLKFNTRVWKLHYQNLFAELNAVSTGQNSNDVLLPKKYMANHYLAFKPTSNLEIGLFESVIFSRQDHFEFNYLNPIIFYRSIEHNLGSPDNALLGLNASWSFLNHFKLYGQFVLDEFKLSEIKAKTGWWANKFGGQIGLKYVDVAGIKGLHGQLEYNVVRPYTYSQSRPITGFEAQSITSYSHGNLALAHALGANFKEIVAKLSYSPSQKLSFEAQLYKYNIGYNPSTGENYGQNILLNNTSRINDFGNEIGQGATTDVLFGRFLGSYQIFTNYYIDLEASYRKATSTDAKYNYDRKYFGLGFRANLAHQQITF